MAVKTKQDLLNYINTYILQNSTGAITGGIMNIAMVDVVDSFFSSSASQKTYIQDLAPINSLGNDDDTYLDSLSAIIYKKENGVWVAKLDFKTIAELAVSLTSGSGVPTVPTTVAVDSHYLDLDSMDLYQFDGIVWTKISSISVVDYSTSEVLTDRKWIDGKPIYEIVIVDNAFTSGGYTHNLNIDTYISVEGFAWEGLNPTEKMPMNKASDAHGSFVFGVLQPNGFDEILTQIGWDNLIIILRYTKN